MMLAQLASHYWRPDYSPAQSAVLTADYAEDLADCTIAEIEIAIREYRRDADNKFFPKSAQLREIVFTNRKHRADVEKLGAPVANEERRPHMWWTKPPYLWQPHWQESDIPEEHRSAFAARLKAKRSAGVEGWSVAEFAGLARKHQQAAE